ncbi:SnoaL-like domain-containing protein [Noviherbaspirillum humi]|uniref:SnoaL-like domain-containing protein n=1 Tax=Noviherbaspirillum humi TaxID=1688639 RepID=A0A239CGY6_9BURK|nr:nuclear transport factor 2 family protein [Noviherbaspirillum humi]SNS19370.1 SnoaL-like domain-containing protein [Noviherbaspirillum humi]
MTHEADLKRVVRFFETITPQSVDLLGDIYTPDAYFKDPFNDVRGLDEIRRIFSHMFVQVQAPRFVVRSAIAQGDEAFLTWDFLFRMKRFSSAEQCIRGATHLRFAADGRLAFHRDYWDAAEELYEKLPLLGGLMRLLKRAARS